jgi:hypothetical protein
MDPIEITRTAGFNSFVHDITETPGVDGSAGGVVGILSLGGITFIRDVILNPNMFSLYTTGLYVEDAYIPTNNRTMCPIGVETFGQGAAVEPVHIAHINEDSESGGTFPGVCISGGGPVSITDSELAPSAASSVQLIGSVGQVTLRNNNLVQLGALPIVDATYATPTAGENVLFENNLYAGDISPTANNYTNFSLPYSVIDHTPTFHHLQYPVVPSPEPGAVNIHPSCFGNTSCAFPVPANAHVGDIEIAVPAITGAPGTMTPPTGWTLACLADNSANAEYLPVYWHVVTPDDTTTYTWTITNSGLNWLGSIAVFSGINPLNPVDICQTSTAASSSSISLTGMTSGDQNDIDVFVVGGNSGGPVFLPSPPSNTVLSFSTVSTGVWSYLPGSTTIPAVTVNNTTSAVGLAGVQLALRPALSQATAMTPGEGAPPLYNNEPGATLQSLATNVPIESPNVIGTVTSSTTISFAKQSVQDITTATTGLTYTLSTVGATVNQDVMIRSHIAGSITGPLWATSSGAIRWAGGSAPTSSGTSGYTDILRLYFDGTNWQEISRSIGNH